MDKVLGMNLKCLKLIACILHLNYIFFFGSVPIINYKNIPFPLTV